MICTQIKTPKMRIRRGNNDFERLNYSTAGQKDRLKYFENRLKPKTKSETNLKSGAFEFSKTNNRLFVYVAVQCLPGNAHQRTGTRS